MYLINDIFEALRSYYRKHNRGMVSPDEFNRGAQYVQNKIIRESFNFLDVIKNKKKMGRVNKNDFDKEKLYLEIIRPLRSNEDLTYNGTGFDYPDDYSFCDTIFYNTREVEELSEQERMFMYVPEALPTENYPVYLEHGTYLEVLPESIESSVKMYYYREQETPQWTYEPFSDSYMFNPSANDFQDFELPRIIFDEILRELILYFSGELKQPDISQLMQSEENKAEQLKNIE